MDGLERLGAESESETIRRWVDPQGGPAPGLREALLRLARSSSPFLRGAAAVCLGRPAEAVALLRKADGSAEVLGWLAEAELQTGDVAAAREHAERAGAAGMPRALCLAAIARLVEGESGKAAALFEKALREDPTDALASGLRGYLVDRQDDPRAARRRLDRAARLRPRAGWPLALRSQLAGQDLEARLADLDRALEREPAAWIYKRRSDCFEKMGRMREAFEDLDRAAGLSLPNAPLHEARGRWYFHRKEYALAAAELTKALELSPREPDLLWQRANAQWLAGKPSLCAADMRRCVALAPDSSRYRLGAVRFDILSGRLGSARAALRRWLKLGDPETRAGARFLMGLYRLRRKDYALAARTFARVGAAGPEGESAAEFSRISRGLAFMSGRRNGSTEGQGRTRRRPVLNVAGLGLDYPKQATLEILKVMSESDILVNNLAGAEAMEFLSLFCQDVRTISFEGDDPERWADKIFKMMKPGRTVTMLTRGHPLVSGHLALMLIQRARREKVELHCYGALSSVDQILALSEEVLHETHWGLQVYDSRLVVDRKVELHAGLPIVMYLGLGPGPHPGRRQREFVLRLGRVLRERYPDDHEVMLYGPRYDSRRLDPVPLKELDERLRAVNPVMFSSLIMFVPPVETLQLS